MGSRAAPHVVMVPFSSPGHAIPFVHFARRLAVAGITITVVSSDRHISELGEASGTLDFTPQGLPLRFLGLRDGMVHLSHHEFQVELRERPEVEERVVQLLEELIADLGSSESQKLRGVPPAAPPVCLLHDMFSTWCQQAAEKLHIEKHMMFPSPVALLSVALQSIRLAQEGRIPVTRGNRDTIITDIPGLPPLRTLDLPSSMLDAASYKWMKVHHMSYRKTDVILGNSFYDLEKTVIDALRNEVLGSPGVQTEYLLEIGPLLPEAHFSDDAIEDAATEDRDPCILWLNTQAPSSVLYVSFGSMATHPAAQLVELASGLEASGQPFLWIVRPPDSPTISEASRTATSITEFLPPGFEERIKGRGMCYSGWAPQTRILRHPATGGFLTHCGWNSTLESVCAGIPMLTWPIQAEQHLNARFLVDTNLAIELRKEPVSEEDLEKNVSIPARWVTKEEIEQKVKCLMQEVEGRAVRENVERMRLSARKAVAPGGQSRRNFETYVHLLHSKALAASQVNL